MRETTQVKEVGTRSGEEPQEEAKRIDLSVPQVAGSAVAAVAGAVAASQLGVYGTVIGAGVMSVVATTGGSVFQHLFRRTGEQIRDVAHVRPKGEPGPDVPDTFRADPEPDPLTDPAPGRVASADPATAHTVPGDPPAPVEATQLLGQADPEATQLLSQADPGAPQLLGQAGPDATRALRVPAADPAEADQATRLLRAVPEPSGPETGEFGEATTHQARTGRWKRPLISAAAVFVLAMGGITGWELVSGHALSGDSGPTISHLTGNRSQPSGDQEEEKAPAPEETPSGEAPSDGGSGAPSTQDPEDGTSSTGTPEEGTSPAPTRPGQQPGTPDDSTGDRSPTPTPTPSAGEPEQPTGQPSGGVPSGAAPEEGAPAG
ncbi:hypothetical protein ABZ649_15225 [Streptomyces albidoflavus]|uniref:Uncharacterized protein n=1 Tax=Streptomyces albidoflavus TaxID=1886 RepID=A0AB37XM16_9ACTN|nr:MULTISPECIES: hypothetical protein [Streptomyces]MYX86873.1 hypothetical protein [Streptomyces sp. SID4915]QLA56107.1 hypothetical protein HWN34_05765 [Streptomyces violascens]AWL35183.1 hypothetical protein B9S66_24755 [Streptomyces sp. SM17]MBK3387369.1 hypothetical protein [Streptomyces sp. DEF1AK]RZE44615.1 hypothetical protein C0Q91_06025 [Streptomyces albidoflavus]